MLNQMKLKNLYVAAAVVLGLSAVCLTGCETKCESCSQETGERRHVQLDLTGSAVQTKAVDVPSLSESNVVKCLLYVFSSQGPLTQVYSSTDGAFDFYLTDNTYDFVAVVNKADLPEGERAASLTKKDLMSRVTVMNDNAVGSFVMCGTLDGHAGSITREEEYGGTIVMPEPNREGYTFDYWEGSVYHAGDSYTVTGEHSFTARWKTDTPSEISEQDTGARRGPVLWILALIVVLLAVVAAMIVRKRSKDIEV